MATVLVAGCGYVGSALAAQLAAEGHEVYGLRRNISLLPTGVHPLRADLLEPESLQFSAAFDYVFYTTGASGMDEAAYRAAYVDGLRNVLDALAQQQPAPKRLFFTSSTGVYHQDGGEWLDETSPAEAGRATARVLLEAEALVHDAPMPGTVVRLAGIYGPGRTRLADQVRAGEAYCIEDRKAYINLIHRDDCAGVLRHLMALDAPEPLYLAVDNEPIERCALLRWLAAQLDMPMPPVRTADEVGVPARGGNRRYSNARLRASGYSFTYPTFREGFGELL